MNPDDGDRCAELRRAIAEMGPSDPWIVVMALLGVLTNTLADMRIDEAELDDLSRRILLAMVEVWRRARVNISSDGRRN